MPPARLATAWALFQGLLIEALPFLLIGVLISAAPRWFAPGGPWLRRLPSHPRGAVAVAVGLALNRRGTALHRQRLSGWGLEPGTALSLDPSGDRLLAALRRLGPLDRQPPPAQPMLRDARSLELQPLPRQVQQVAWLPAG